MGKELKLEDTMADYKKLVPIIKKWEGGYANDPDDDGGCTMCGVTISVYQRYYGKDKTCDDLKHITEEEWENIFKTGYWDKMKADEIENQSIANLCVDMLWGSGPRNAIRHIQGALGLKEDGVVGKNTLAALNSPNTAKTFRTLWTMRYNWFHKIAEKGNNQKFLRGWLRRLNSFTYSAINK